MPEVATGGTLCLGLLHIDGGFGRVAASAFGFYATALSGNEAKLCRVKAFGGLLELRVELGDALIVNATLFAEFFLCKSAFGGHARVTVLAISFYTRASGETKVEAYSCTVHPVDIDLGGIGDSSDFRIVLVE